MSASPRSRDRLASSIRTRPWSLRLAMTPEAHRAVRAPDAVSPCVRRDRQLGHAAAVVKERAGVGGHGRPASGESALAEPPLGGGRPDFTLVGIASVQFWPTASPPLGSGCLGCSFGAVYFESCGLSASVGGTRLPGSSPGPAFRDGPAFAKLCRSDIGRRSLQARAYPRNTIPAGAGPNLSGYSQ
jgi:hypothetical protein